MIFRNVLGLFMPLAVVALVVIGIRQFTHGSTSVESRTHVMRRVFQYSMLFVAVIISAIGTSGLLTRVFSSGQSLTSDSAALARDASFTIVGIPVLIGLTLWTQSIIRKNPREVDSFAWGSFVTLVDVVSLLTGLVAVTELAKWATNLPDTTWPSSTARVIVWGTTWVSIRLVKRAASTSAQRQVGNLIGSTVGLGLIVAGAVSVISSLLQIAFNLQNDAFNYQTNDATVAGAITLTLGAGVWGGYWFARARLSERNSLWHAYVLLIGVGGAFVTAISAASMAIYQLLVWYFGTPNIDVARVHFNDTPANAAYALMGLSSWWYHRWVLHEAGRRQRTEVRRIYEYMISGVALGSIAVGIGILVAAGIQSLTDSDLITTSDTTNTLLAALTLLGVGTPIWLLYWSRIQVLAHAEPETEAPTPTRRAYLFGLFGIGGVASLIALITGVFLLLQDVFQGDFASSTFRDMRFAIGVLVTAGVLATYHYAVYRGERQFAQVAWRHTRNILLVGPKDEELAHEIQQRTGDRVQIWVQTNIDSKQWSKPEVLALVDSLPDQDALILLNSHGLEMIPVVRQ